MNVSPDLQDPLVDVTLQGVVKAHLPNASLLGS